MALPVRSSTKLERVKLKVARAKKSDNAKLPRPNVRRIRLRRPSGPKRHRRLWRFGLEDRPEGSTPSITSCSIMSGSIDTNDQACNR